MSELANRLEGESSPYLLQHADNPVHWQPWDEQALRQARTLRRPILLSIGYSACHWCHVMAHESFEDPAVAAVMNERFVNVKVDREERPDLDKVYQLAQQLLTRQPGGWPLTMFLDPDTLVPFFGGTYFPRKARQPLPAFPDLLHRVSEVFHSRRDELTTQGEKISEVLASLDVPSADAGEADPEALLAAARRDLEARFDRVEGGFGSAPKFPMPATVDRLLRGWAFARRDGDNDRTALEMVMTTLTRMARGGIHDHLGGGFCRYATDRRWMIPHFEKMLYDNGQLLSLYSDALGVGPDALFEGAVQGIADWLLGDLQHPDGAFFAALDADSEGEEGRYYLWKRDQVKRLLDDDEYLVVETLYGLDKPANFEGRWNLHRYDAWPSVVSRLSLEPDRAAALLASARSKLLAERRTRVAPGLDDKILTAWNAFAIRGLAQAGMRLGRGEWIAAAQRAADFLRERVFDAGVLYATWKAGQPRHRGYLDDYAGLLDAMLVLLSAQWREQDAAFAATLAEALLADFEDPDHGGFFFTAHDHEQLLFRPKPVMDDATPPGNALAARALADLGHLMGEPRYLTAADRTIDWSLPVVAQHPAGHCAMLSALEDRRRPREQIIVCGPREALGPWLAAARAGYHPGRRVYGIPNGVSGPLPAYLPASVSADSPVAYRCEGFSCSLPETSLKAFEASL